VKQMQEVLEGMKDVESEVVILPGAKHGFAVRGNPEDKKEKEQADQAEDQCVRWFEKYLV
jgi:dienelactone hydrolase